MKKLVLLLATFGMLFSLSAWLTACQTYPKVDGGNTDGGEEICLHVYIDEYTCHDRTCIKCGKVLKMTTNHTFVDNKKCVCGMLNPEYYTEGLIFGLINDDIEYSVIGYDGVFTEVVIPSIYNGKSVINIGDSAFKWCTSLTSIIIPDSVTNIGEEAFRSCTALTSLEIPASVKSIGDYAFIGSFRLVEVCNNSTLTIEKKSYGLDYLLNVYSNTSEKSKLSYENDFVIYTDRKEKLLIGYFGSSTEITIPKGITKINDFAFHNCILLTSIKIPVGVTSIGECAFYYCRNLEFVIFEENSKLESIGSEAFLQCYKLTSIKIPVGVTSIGECAFFFCSDLKFVIFEQNSKLESIGQEAFEGCSLLTSIEIPKSVTKIGFFAFLWCDRLVEVCNNSALVIENGRCGLSRLLNVYSSNNGKSKLSYDNDFVVYSDGEEKLLVGYLGKSTEITIPNGITKINIEALSGCTSLTSIEVPSSVTSIEEYAFNSCKNLKKVTFEENSKLESIENSAFEDCCLLTNIKIPASVRSIGEDAFANCSSFTSIEIPASVTSIMWGAFDGCENLTDIYCELESQPSGWDRNWKDDCNATVHWGYKGE